MYCVDNEKLTKIYFVTKTVIAVSDLWKLEEISKEGKRQHSSST